MKKICPNCGHINAYSHTVCEKCGYDLEKQVRYKICPNCGKEFDLNADECDECRYKLIVQGKKIAQTFDETQKEEVPIWLRIVAAFVPVIGIAIAAAYCIIAVEDKKMERETAKHLIIISFFVQIIWICIVIFVIGLITGSGLDLMRSISNRNG